MMLKRICSLSFSVLFILVLASCTSVDVESIDLESADLEAASLQTNRQTSAAKQSAVNIIMMRGGFNGVFSTGVTDMAAKLQSNGVPAQARNWDEQSKLYQEILASVKKHPDNNLIILAGHSLGARTALTLMGDLAKKDIEVDLVVVFDTLGTPPVTRNVKRLVNYNASGSKTKPRNFKGGPGFGGKIVNKDIRLDEEMKSANHWNIVNQEELQRQAIAEIEKAYRSFKR